MFPWCTAFYLAFLLHTYFFSGLLFLPFVDLKFGRRLCHPLLHVLVRVLYPVFSVSASVATRLEYDVYLIRTYAEVTNFCLRYEHESTRFVAVIAYYLLFLFVFLLR